MRRKATLSKKIKSLIWKQAPAVDCPTPTIMRSKEMTQSTLQQPSAFSSPNPQNVSSKKFLYFFLKKKRPEKDSGIFSRKRFSNIWENGTLFYFHKNEFFLYFGRSNFLYFLEKKLCLYFRKIELLHFRTRNFLAQRLKGFSYILWNRTLQP